MTQGDLFNLEKGRALKEDGIQRAIEHAEAEVPSWADRAVLAATAWVMRRPPEPFFMHEVREALEAEGFPQPPELRAWGAIPRRLVKAGVIRSAGIAPSTKPEQHMALKSRWVRRLG